MRISLEFSYSIWLTNYRINFPGFDILIDIYVQLLIGWRVDNASSQTSYFNVTYVPFAQGWMTTIFNGTALPGAGWYTVDVQMINASVISKLI